MEIKTKTKVITEYVLNESEWRTVKQCLVYAKHRLKSNPDAGIHKARVKLKDVEAILNDNGLDFTKFNQQLDEMAREQF